MEKYLARTEKLASIGQLASGVAHEINNPLGVIKCYADLIAKEQNPESQLMKDIRIIQKHTNQCKSVVAGLLNFARLSEPQKARTDITTCIEEVLSFLELQWRKGPITVHKEFDPDTPLLTVDRQKIKQVFMNLFMNAEQALSGGGKITVRTILRKRKTGWPLKWLIRAAEFPESVSIVFSIRFSPPRRRTKARAWGFPSVTASSNSTAETLRWKARWERGASLRCCCRWMSRVTTGGQGHDGYDTDRR